MNKSSLFAILLTFGSFGIMAIALAFFRQSVLIEYFCFGVAVVMILFALLFHERSKKIGIEKNE